VVAVLQGWSKSAFSGRAIGLTFIVLSGAGAWWGLRTLMGWSH
jgi:hypothetical protein